MRWVRNYRRFGAWSGLAALALQIVLSFGHIHVGNKHISGARGWFSAAASQHFVTTRISENAPGQNAPDNDDYCAICASIFLASTSFVPPPPVLLVPTAFKRIEHASAAAHGVNEPRRVAFRSRAPPQA
jgi:hypothetical protein